MRVVVGMSGATGSIYGIRLLEELKKQGVETHLVVSSWAEETIITETDYALDDVLGLADVVYQRNDLGATVSSGSFKHDGMVVVPCSMKTVAAISSGYSDNLLSRAADVTIKEKRKLILVTRESPLSAIHLRNMLSLAEQGVVIMPPMPAFYARPQSIEELVNQTVGRILDQFGLDNNLVKRWEGD